METSVDKVDSQVSYSRTKQQVNMSLSRSDLYSFQTDDVKPQRPRRQWCLNLIIVYLILLTGVNAFLLYKVLMPELSTSAASTEKLTSSNHIPLGGEQDDVDLPMMIRNNSQETKTLKGYLGALQSQVNSLCGEEGQLGRLRADLSLVNTSTYMLEDKLAAINLRPGPPGPPGLKGDRGVIGLPGEPGMRGPTGVQGERGERGSMGTVGPPGVPGSRGQSVKGEKGDSGVTGVQGPPGRDGAKGAKGDTGTRGLPGEPGMRGPAGTRGEKGEKGNNGVGSAGPPGPQGPKGGIGAQGPPGSSGPRGSPGPLGPPGPAGPRGTVGPPGVPGSQGQSVKGEKGATGGPGVQGPPGRDGAKGAKGDTGGRGSQGTAGATGLKGQRGDTGLTGPAGPPGPRGPAGSSGSTGSRGPPGPPGPKGDRGSTMASNVRLAGGTSRGRVEVRYNGEWGTVCDDNFDTTDGTVICRMLGFSRATSTYTAGSGSGTIWLDDLACTGSELSIFDCTHNGMGSHNCGHGEDVGVQCA